MSNSLIFIASDHRGFPLKETFVLWLKEHGYIVRNLGPETSDRCDGSDYAQRLAAAMKEEPNSLGVLICGTGQVMAMTANRYAHLRAALCTNATMARLARQHNHANVLALGASIIGDEIAQDCLETFLKTQPLPGRYAERVKKMIEMGGL